MIPNDRKKEDISMKRSNKRMRWIATGMVFVVLFLCVGMTVVHSNECEKAFLRCSYDPYWQAVAFGGIYCVTGYVFCKKYIEG